MGDPLFPTTTATTATTTQGVVQNVAHAFHPHRGRLDTSPTATAVSFIAGTVIVQFHHDPVHE